MPNKHVRIEPDERSNSTVSELTLNTESIAVNSNIMNADGIEEEEKEVGATRSPNCKASSFPYFPSFALLCGYLS